MAFTFNSNVLIDSTTFSYLVFGVSDGTVGLSSAEIFQTEWLVNSVNEQILGYIDRNIIFASYTDVFDSLGSDEIIPTNYPIQTVSSIKIAPLNDFNNATPINPQWYQVNRESIVFHGSVLPTGRATVQVVYSAGYPLENVPKNLVLALVEQFKSSWNRLKIGSIDAPSNYESLSKMGESFTVSKKIAENGLSPQVIQLLNDFKRVEVPLAKVSMRTTG